MGRVDRSRLAKVSRRTINHAPWTRAALIAVRCVRLRPQTEIAGTSESDGEQRQQRPAGEDATLAREHSATELSRKHGDSDDAGDSVSVTSAEAGTLRYRPDPPRRQSWLERCCGCFQQSTHIYSAPVQQGAAKDPAAADLFSVGDICEVMIVAHDIHADTYGDIYASMEGKWAFCRLRSKGDTANTFNIDVLPGMKIHHTARKIAVGCDNGRPSWFNSNEVGFASNVDVRQLRLKKGALSLALQRQINQLDPDFEITYSPDMDSLHYCGIEYGLSMDLSKYYGP